MRAWIVHRPGPLRSSRPLLLVEREVPAPAANEVRIRVRACGVCRTDLHLAEGDLPPKSPDTVPGHEIVGVVDAVGSATSELRLGDRVGVAWLRSTCGRCPWCTGGRENLCPWATFTGWDADGGYADYAIVEEDFAYRLPDAFDDEHAAPLLCAGIIGFRALRRANLPRHGRLGIYGFGASAHLAAQIALSEGATVHVLTRSAQARTLALSLGATSAGGAYDEPPEPLDAAILFAPVGDLVPVALQALDRGGTLAVAGIHLTDIPPLNYQQHLFQERNLVSVTANTRSDGEEFLRAAALADVRVSTSAYAFEDAARALADLAADQVNGAAVIMTGA